MWLPRDERHLLLAYYANIFDLKDRNVAKYLDHHKWFRLGDWTSVLASLQWVPFVSSRFVQRRARSISEYGDSVTRDSDVDITAKGGMKIIERTVQLQKRLEIANAHLQERHLVGIRHHQSETGVTGILLTLQGYDLARRYQNWLGRTGLWFREYKDHWFWLVVSFLGGILGAFLMQLFSK